MRLIPFKRFVVLEGGNIKVKTAAGEVAAAPFKVANRSQQISDVHNALSSIHDSFKSEHNIDLFGKNKKALGGSAYAGSTKHFMNKSISDKEFTQHKPSVGDIDAQIPVEHKDKLTQHLTAGKKFGNYSVEGVKKHGTEVSAVMKHELTGQHHQFDFEGVKYHNDEPAKSEQFLHSSDWGDTKAGIKGVHHKMLLNAAGGDTHKFSITHGLRSRTDESDKGSGEPDHVSKKLFGNSADHSKIHSFTGVADLIKKHIPKENHQAIYDKFKSSVAAKKDTDHDNAISHLKKTLGTSDSIHESKDNIEQHTSVIPMVGFSPISHMGHANDLGQTLKKLPGTKHIGISAKADAFSPDERKNILHRQWGDKQNNVHAVKGAGETIRHAHDSLKGSGPKVLHLLVGGDRSGLAHNLKKDLENNKIKEMEGRKFDRIEVHQPPDTERSHGMSGTKMRQAAANGDSGTFNKHLGPMFTSKESSNIMSRIKNGISSGAIPLKR